MVSIRILCKMRTNNPSIPKEPQWLQKGAHSVRLRQDELSPSGSPLRNCLPLGHHRRFLPLARSLWIETSNPVLGGLFIGGAQAASLTLTRGPIGVSTAYERLGDSTWPSPSPLVFALGMPVGTWSLSNALGMTPAMETTQMSVAGATVGGVLLERGLQEAALLGMGLVVWQLSRRQVSQLLEPCLLGEWDCQGFFNFSNNFAVGSLTKHLESLRDHYY